MAPVSLILILLSCGFLAGCSNPSDGVAPDRKPVSSPLNRYYAFTYVPPAKVADRQYIRTQSPPGVSYLGIGFPSQARYIDTWGPAADLKNPAVRAHAWNLWAALTTLSPYIMDTWPNPAVHIDNNPLYLPVFMTWYSGYEVYVVNADAQSLCSTTQAPLVDDYGIKRCLAGSLLGANKLSLPQARYMIEMGANNVSDLQHDKKTPMDLPPFNGSGFNQNTIDNVSFSVAPVYYLLKNHAYNLLPYASAQQEGTMSKYLSKPALGNWTQCVLIKVGNAGDEPPTTCNLGNGNIVEPVDGWQRASLSQFLSVPLTKAMVEGLAHAQIPSAPMQPSLHVSLANAVQPEVGDIAVLLGMHIAVREVRHWVRQTFYWSAEKQPATTVVPNPFGFSDNQPGSVPSWAQYYNLRGAAVVVSPQ